MDLYNYGPLLTISRSLPRFLLYTRHGRFRWYIYIYIAAAVATAAIAAVVIADVTNRTELEAWVEIRQLKEFEVFNSLRLSIVLLIAIYY